MINGGLIFSLHEMRFAIKRMNDIKAIDESGVIAEYLEALK